MDQQQNPTTDTVPTAPIEPTTVELKSIIVPVPWYKKILGSTQKSQVSWYLSFVILFVVGFVVAHEIQRPTTTETHAGSNTVTLSLQPTNLIMPPKGIVQLWVTGATSAVAFVDAELSFDYTKVQLTQEISVIPISTKLTRVLKVTSMADANKYGKVSVIVALDPSMRSNPPSGTFELATLSFTPLGKSNALTSVSVNTTTSQVVNKDTTLFSLRNTDTSTSSIVLYPTPTPSPSPSLTPTATPKPIASPTLKPTTSTTLAPSTPAPSSGNLLQNSSFDQTGSNWLNKWWFEADSGAAATISQDTTTAADGAASARIDVTNSSSVGWHVQLMNGLGIISGRTYTVSFWAKAETPRTIELNISHRVSPFTNYFDAKASLTQSWQKFTYTFNSHVTDNDVLLLFYFANNTGNVWLDGVSVQ